MFLRGLGVPKHANTSASYFGSVRPPPALDRGSATSLGITAGELDVFLREGLTKRVTRLGR